MKYKVKTLALAVKNNRIAKHGELVDDSELTINPSELVQSGAIELHASVSETNVEADNSTVDSEEEVSKDVDNLEVDSEEVLKADPAVKKVSSKK